jgi:hypothetical protein
LQKVFLSKTNSILHGNNMLDATASIIVGFLWRDSGVSSTQIKRHIEAIRAYLHLETPKLQEVFLSKTHSILTGKQSDRCSCF